MLLARRVTNPLVWLLVVPLSISGCKCKKDKGDDQGTVAVADVGSRLAVTSIDPSRAPANKAFSATIRGSGFETGASVSLGSTAASRVTFLNSNQLAVEIPGLPVGRYDVQVANPDGTAVTLRGGLTIGEDDTFVSCDPATVYFATDKSDLSSDARSTLDGRSDCYARTSGTVRVAGHADERGTTDYNLALGQRRADSVKKYLSGKGVTSGRISTISYGEEQPAVDGHDESAWSKNRRAEVTVTR